MADLLTNLIDVAATADLPLNRARAVTIGDRKIALYHTARGFFATENVCPHRGGPLAEGDIIGDVIVCPWHLWSFDIESGVCPGNAEVRVKTYEVSVEGDRILVRVE